MFWKKKRSTPKGYLQYGYGELKTGAYQNVFCAKDRTFEEASSLKPERFHLLVKAEWEHKLIPVIDCDNKCDYFRAKAFLDTEEYLYCGLISSLSFHENEFRGWLLVDLQEGSYKEKKFLLTSCPGQDSNYSEAFLRNKACYLRLAYKATYSKPYLYEQTENVSPWLNAFVEAYLQAWEQHKLLIEDRWLKYCFHKKLLFSSGERNCELVKARIGDRVELNSRINFHFIVYQIIEINEHVFYCTVAINNMKKSFHLLRAEEVFKVTEPSLDEYLTSSIPFFRHLGRLRHESRFII